METNPVVAAPAANPVPAVQTPASPAPAAPAAPQADVADEKVVTLGELMGGQKADDKGSGAPKPDVKTPEKPANAEDQKPQDKQEQPFYKSQKEVDVAVSKRLRAQESKYQPVLQLVDILRDMNPGLTDEQIRVKLEGDRDEKLGLNPELSAALKRRGMFGQQPVQPESEEGIPESDDEREAAAEMIGSQAEEIAKLDPDFDLEAFLGKNADKLPALSRGKISLSEIYFAQEGPNIIERVRNAAFEAGKAEAVKNIRDRNDRVPAPVSQSAPATVSTDFSTMPKKQWDEMQKNIKAAQAHGVKVRL